MKRRPQDRHVCLLRAHPCPFEVNNNQCVVFFFSLFTTGPWVPLSDSEPQAALKFDPTQCGIFHILLFFGLTVYIKHNINPVYPGMSSKRKHSTLHAWGREDQGVRFETNSVCESALFCHKGLCHVYLKRTQTTKPLR